MEGADRTNNSNIDDAETEQQILSFKSLQVDGSTVSQESSSATNDSQVNLNGTGNFKPWQETRTMKPQGRNIESIKVFEKATEDGSSLQGNWTLYCSTELDGCGRSEANEIWKLIQEMHRTRPELFPIKPLTYQKGNGTIAVSCYTPDYMDKAFILSAARALREAVNYPYIMYYHKRVGKLTSFYMHTPDDEFYVNIEGSWILEEM